LKIKLHCQPFKSVKKISNILLIEIVKTELKIQF
jgi:hypothetical protein